MSRNWKIDFPRIDTFEICKQFCSTDYITMLLIVTSLLTFFELYFSLINKYILSYNYNSHDMRRWKFESDLFKRKCSADYNNIFICA